NLRGCVDQLLAVVPIGRDALRAALEAEGCEVLATDRTRRGMGASLAAGIEASTSHEGWIVALGDMPCIGQVTMAAVRSALDQGAVLAAPFARDGRRGHPVGFSRALRDALIALDGDVGARAILEHHAHEIVRLQTDDPGIFIDIDTPQDLAGVNLARP
ncbi:MAG: nucleotidyltransferase family protein, partial [Usitatibacter sp.]